MPARSSNSAPNIQNKPVQTRVVRYEATSGAAEFSLKRSDLLNWIGFSVDATTDFYPLCDAVRLVQVRLHSLTNDVAEAQLEWNGVHGSNACTTAVGSISNPLLISQRPPVGSVASLWSDRGSNESDVLFTMSATDRSYLDLHIEYVLGSGIATALTLNGNAADFAVTYLPMPNDTSGDFIPLGLYNDQLA
jgi:hypothetical protein